MKSFYKIYISVLLSAVMIFFGANLSTITSSAVPVIAALPDVVVNVTATKSNIEIGDKQTLKLQSFPTGGSTEWVSSNPSVATVDENGVVTAVSKGITNITARYSYNGSIYTDSIYISVVDKSNVLGIQNVTDYYIMNNSTGRLMGLETASDSVLTNVHTGERTESTLYQWRTHMQIDGTFQFISVYR